MPRYDEVEELLKDIVSDWKECDKKKGIEQTNCLFEVLYRLTRAQDYLQLSIPKHNASVVLSTNLTDIANAILLEVSKYRGDIRPIVGIGYASEKVESMIKGWNGAVHDYNLVQRKKGLLRNKIEYKIVPEREELLEEEDIVDQLAYIFKGFD